MTDEAVKLTHRAQVLGTLSDAHPVWLQLREILEEDVTATEEALCRPDLADSVRAYHAGYLAHALDLKRNLAQWRAEGMKER